MDGVNGINSVHEVDDDRKNLVIGTALSFLGGYVDTLGFVALFGLFTAHVTGNFVLIGAGLARQSNVDLLIKFMAFPAFIVGVAIARLLIAAMEHRKLSALRYSMLLQLALLSGFMVLGLLASPIRAETSMAIAAGLLGAMAMGIHSAYARLLLPHLAPTSMMTGNVTQVVIDAVDVMRGAGDAAVRQRCARFLWTVLAFGLGAIGAAFGYLYAGFWSLLAPLAILLRLIMLE